MTEFFISYKTLTKWCQSHKVLTKWEPQPPGHRINILQFFSKKLSFLRRQEQGLKKVPLYGGAAHRAEGSQSYPRHTGGGRYPLCFFSTPHVIPWFALSHEVLTKCEPRAPGVYLFLTSAPNKKSPERGIKLLQPNTGQSGRVFRPRRHLANYTRGLGGGHRSIRNLY